MKGVLGQAIDAFYAVLDGATLADIAGDGRELSGILHFHRPALRAAALPAESTS
jgi:hypothetical protein